MEKASDRQDHKRSFGILSLGGAGQGRVPMKDRVETIVVAILMGACVATLLFISGILPVRYLNSLLSVFR